MSPQSDSDANGLWAITSYFNPVCYGRRLLNFRTFRRCLNVPLVAVELSYGSDFELEENDADILIQLSGGAILWQKERLLNVALQALPKHCTKVAWLDCDILFGVADWAEATSSLLDRFPIVQMYKHVHHLSAYWTPVKDYLTEVELTQASAAYSIACGAPVDFPDVWGGANVSAKGFGWAARRELLDQHGFFDACIVGGGDSAIACAASHHFEQLIRFHYMNELQQERYVAWAEPFYKAVRAEIGYLEGDIFHLWHGDVRGRRARTRHEGLQRFRFDPFTDIAIDANGCWRWNTEKQEMHDYIRDYFLSRKEDG